MSKGLCNWKTATSLIPKHPQSSCHRETVEVVITQPATNKNVSELLVQQHAKEKGIEPKNTVEDYVNY